MEIERTFRSGPIRLIYSQPDILEKIKHDGYSHHQLMNPDFSRDIYLLGWTDENELLGMMKLEPYSNVTFRMHGAVLKSQRLHALDLTKTLTQWVFDNTLAQSIITEIPSKHQGTNNFMDKLGAVTVGVIKNNVQIDGVLYDTIIKQIERNK
jgi:RimJ/RimL family protein N-acetyltransferase